MTDEYGFGTELDDLDNGGSPPNRNDMHDQQQQQHQQHDPTTHSLDDDDVLQKLLDEISDSDNDEENKRHADGTRERNLILWEAATWKQKIFAVFEPGSFPSDTSQIAERLSLTVAAVMVTVIILSCLTVIVESYPEYVNHPVPMWVEVCEVVSVVIFTWDLILRFITSPDKHEFVTDLLNWIDLVAVLPFYIEQGASISTVSELRIVRVLRLARIVRVFRLLNISKIPGMAAVLSAIHTSYPGIVLFICVGVVLLMMTATAMFYAERGTRVGGFWVRCHKWFSEEACLNGYRGLSPFQSIVDAFWWSFNTLSTVGLGDVAPVHVEGELVACISMVLSVFILAIPPMLLTGNFDASHSKRILNTGWVKLAEQQRKLKRSDLESPRTQIIRKMGWNDDEPADFDADPVSSQKDNQKENDTNDDTNDSRKVDINTSNTNLSGGSLSLREAARQRQKLRRKRRAERIGRPVGSVQFGGHTIEIYRRQGRANMHKYFYDPLFRIAVCDDGAPVITIIRGRCGMPSMCRLQLELDHPRLRQAALDLVHAIDPIGTVQVDLGGGFEIKHFASSRAATDNHLPAWNMKSAIIAPQFRNSDCAVYFSWTQRETTLNKLSDDEVAELALSHVVGSSLHIRLLLPIQAKLLRIPVEQQIIHHTRFQRELNVIAKKISDEDNETLAYISTSMLQTMLEGVSGKIIVDPMLRFEDPARVDHEVADRLVSRLRQMKVSEVPSTCKDAIFEPTLLALDDIVHEVPMSLFDADALDEVEEDALGYVDAHMVSMQARTIRVDIKTEFDVPDA